PHRALALQALQEEALAATHDPHAHALGERARDLDLAEVAEVGVPLADDLAVELVLPDRAREGAADADSARASRRVRGEEHALAREERPLQPAGQPARH